MTHLGWPIIIFAIVCALVWRKHREKQGKRVSWYTDLLVAGGLAFAANFMVGFGETFIPSFTRSFTESYRRSSGGAGPSTGTVYLVLAAFFLILAVLVTGLVLGLRYIWKLWKPRNI